MIAMALGRLTPALSTNFPCPAVCKRGFLSGLTMVKETKFLRNQADKAERIAQAVTDVEISQRYMSMARAYRSQADILKAKRKAAKKRG
ncbi:hypothetical protein V1290_000348 [Bradyrhizobium sp. AZCC 1578]